MGKLQPIDRVIETAKRKQVARCPICGRLFDENDREHALVHAACKSLSEPTSQA